MGARVRLIPLSRVIHFGCVSGWCYRILFTNECFSGTLAGGVGAGFGDFAAQEIAQHHASGTCEGPKPYNTGETVGAVIGGALAGLLPADALVPMIATAPISWGITTAGAGIGGKLNK